MAAAAGGKAKKKWSKGKVKEKSSNAVVPTAELLDKMNKDVPSYRFISVSILVDRLKINGSLARACLKDLETRNLIQKISTHHTQMIYTRATVE